MFIPPYTHENICLQERPDATTVVHNGSKVFIDHSNTYYFEDRFNLDINNTYRMINIRNPIDRFISHMYYFDKINPQQCSYKVLKDKAEQYGMVFINCLTHIRYQDQILDIETRFNLAREELDRYNFIFKSEDLKNCVDRFNDINPFGLVLKEVCENQSNSSQLKISKQTINNIRKLLEPEILLLSDFYHDSIDRYSY